MNKKSEIEAEQDHQDIKRDESARKVTETSPKPKKEFEIDIFRGWCKSCGICSAFCPRECIEVDEDGSPFVSDSSRCTGCGWCELHCPDFAISVRPRKMKRRCDDAEE